MSGDTGSGRSGRRSGRPFRCSAESVPLATARSSERLLSSGSVCRCRQPAARLRIRLGQRPRNQPTPPDGHRQLTRARTRARRERPSSMLKRMANLLRDRSGPRAERKHHWDNGQVDLADNARHDSLWPCLSHYDGALWARRRRTASIRGRKSLRTRTAASGRCGGGNADEGLPVHRHMHRVARQRLRVQVRDRRLAADSSAADDRNRRSLQRARARSSRSLCCRFTNLSPDPENEYFADGLTDEVTADLSKVRALPRDLTNVGDDAQGDGQGPEDDRSRAGGSLYILEGSVRRAGSPAADHRAAHRRQHGPSPVGRQVRRDRRGRLRVPGTARPCHRRGPPSSNSPPTKTGGSPNAPSANLHAYECYLQARQEGWRWRRDAIDHAIRLLHNGLAIVGENAGLYAALGLVYLQYREAGLDFGERPLQEAEVCARKVFMLAPESAPGVPAAWLHRLFARPDPGGGS